MDIKMHKFNQLSCKLGKCQQTEIQAARRQQMQLNSAYK